MPKELKEFAMCLNNHGNLEAHKLGCREVAKMQNSWSMFGKDLEDAIQDELDNFHYQDQDFQREDIKVANCLK